MSYSYPSLYGMEDGREKLRDVERIRLGKNQLAPQNMVFEVDIANPAQVRRVRDTLTAILQSQTIKDNE